MKLVRPDYYIFGYRIFSVQSEDIAKCAGRLLNNGLTAKISASGEFAVFEPKRISIESALSGIPYKKSELLGIPGIIYRNRKRYGAFAAVALLVIYYIFSLGVVWDVRIEGNEEMSTVELEDMLQTVGLCVGTRWSDISRSEIERQALENIEGIAWLNINRRGTIAYVTVKEKSIPEQDDESGYSNIVASADCVIEEITVKRGIAMVKLGDTVKQGQLLISGVIPAELGGGFVHAEGTVIGMLNESVTARAERVETERSYSSEQLKELSFKFFGFSINIFKNYGNSDCSCAIIEDTEKYVLFGKYQLPLEVLRVFHASYEDTPITYTDEELTKITLSRLEHKRRLKLSDAELVKLRSEGAFDDAGYSITSYMTVLRNVGEERIFAEQK